MLDLYDDDADRAFMRETEYVNFVYVDRGYYFNLADYDGKGLHVVDGRRLTTDVPKNPARRIHIFGQCTARGSHVIDSHTIESCLQRKLNAACPGTWEVVNYGVAGRTGGDMNDLNYILCSDFRAGDVVICLAAYRDSTVELLKTFGAICLETSSVLAAPTNVAKLGRWFLDIPLHINHRACELIADHLFASLDDRLELSSHSIDDAARERVSFYDEFMPAVVNSRAFKNYIERLKNILGDQIINRGGVDHAARS